MSNNKQQPKPENPNNQFSNTEPLTHAQRVATVNTMSNNKQSSVEWYIIERHIIEIQSRLGLISPIEYDAKLIKIEEQAKAMHKEEQSRFTIDYFNWLHTNQYKYNPKVKMYQKMMINETLFFTVEELMIEFNKIQGGNNE